ncbi:MAG: putative ABC transporter permease [Bacilli bacterium]|nr:putative ABC transporter permease [Bacilli bacterium]
MKEIITYSFLIFILCAFIGYFLEVLWIFIGSKKLVNRGFLCGPVIPIYGVGAVLILFSLLRYYDDPIVVFTFGIIITSALEYFTSFLLEKVFHNKWWDYSDVRYNLNGRICLGNSLAFGILSLVIIYLVAPLIFMLFSFFEFKTWCLIAIIVGVVFTLDVIYSIIIAYNLRHRIIIVEELKNEKIALIPVIFEKRLKESIAGLKAFPSRLLKAFPNLEKEYHQPFEIMKREREQLKNIKKELKKQREKVSKK